MPDGTEKEVAFEEKGDEVYTEEYANVLDPVVLFIS